jgi:hypothetical protein
VENCFTVRQQPQGTKYVVRTTVYNQVWFPK